MPAGTGLKDATAIVGIGQTPFAKHLPEDERTLACRAVLAALDDAGIDPGRSTPSPPTPWRRRTRSSSRRPSGSGT